MATIDIDNDFLELFFGITNMQVPKDVNLTALKNQLANVVEVLQDLNKNAKTPYISKALGNEDEEQTQTKEAILIIDDLGVITYQLKVLLSDLDMDIDCSQEIYDAVAKYKNRKHQYIIMDLFIPTEREGFILLSELKKMAKAFDVKSIIGIITASPRKEIEQQCKSRGADFFLEKNNDWQHKLSAKMHEYIDQEEDDDDDF